MSLQSSSLPENIRRRMAPETRREIGKAAMTQPEADAKFNAKREKVLQENIACLLRQRNIVFFRQRMDRRTTGKVGQPDFIFAVNGQACAVECKLPGQSLTMEQFRVVTDMRLNGWTAEVVHTEGEFLKLMGIVEEAQNE